ncbi:hypothetical protein O9G_003952 [Rozella allomycis CSF55]|uniref:GAF domain-containing protein n=1 Tax=Rozella allomycis (strain CSF55) TaxID=988480 RepID=A0A075AZE1_ROZAC|nr:hypothetical protein O9G_003952 [Rozella allomycis CSF55]|eukprot:EPZ35519.1 hypothetical protein O9G_003952 [Rozella allomycis CSF55]
MHLSETSQTAVYISTQAVPNLMFGEKMGSVVKRNNNTNFGTKNNASNHIEFTGDLYSKLVDNNYNLKSVLNNYEHANENDLRDCIAFLQQKCTVIHSLLNLVNRLSTETGLLQVCKGIFETTSPLLQILNMTLYKRDNITGEIYVFYSTLESFIQDSSKVLREEDIAHGQDVASSATIYNTCAFKSTEYYIEPIKNRYPKDTNCVLTCPIKSRNGALVGILEAINKVPGVSPYFDKNDEMLLSTLGSIISFFISLETMNMERETAKGTIGLIMKTVMNATKADPDNSNKAILCDIAEPLAKLLKCDRYVVHEVDYAKNELVPIKSNAPLAYSCSLQLGIPSASVQKKQLINVLSATKHLQYYSAYDKKTNYATKSTLVYPLSFSSKISFVLEFLNKNSPFDRFDAQDEEYLSFFFHLMDFRHQLKNSKIELRSCSHQLEEWRTFWNIFSRHIAENLSIICLNKSGNMVQCFNLEKFKFTEVNLRTLRKLGASTWLKIRDQNNIENLLTKKVSFVEERSLITISEKKIVATVQGFDIPANIISPDVEFLISLYT